MPGTKKKSKKSKQPAPEPEPEPEPIDSDNSDYSGLEDSDDEEPEVSPEQKEATEKAVAQMKKLAQNHSKKKRGPETKRPDDGTGVIYLGHVPYGFFEEQMEGYFSQFGLVTQLRLARNRKTGKSKHYAFIEFDDRDVAVVVAQAMNGYMMMGRTLICTVVPPQKVHPMMFRGAGHITPHLNRNISRISHNKKTRTDDQQKRRVKRLLQKERKRRAGLAAMGVEYSFPGYNGMLTGQKRKKPEPEPEPVVKQEPVVVPASTGKKKKSKKSTKVATTSDDTKTQTNQSKKKRKKVLSSTKDVKTASNKKTSRTASSVPKTTPKPAKTPKKSKGSKGGKKRKTSA